MSNNIDEKMIELQAKINTLVEEHNKLVAEKAAIAAEEEAAKKKHRTKEQKELVKIRETIKKNIDKYNDLAVSSGISTSVGLLTKGGGAVYETEDGETTDGEYFSDGDDYGFNTYGPKNVRYGWFPSSLNC